VKCPHCGAVTSVPDFQSAPWYRQVADVIRRRRAPIVFAGLAVCLAALASLALVMFFQSKSSNTDALNLKRPITKEIYGDFRGKPPMSTEFRLEGPDLDAVTKSEEAGFRVTLPTTRTNCLRRTRRETAMASACA
jgi:hypothetical protein